MIDASTVAWIEEGAERGESVERADLALLAPSDEARRALEEWGRARGVTLAPERAEKARAIAVDWSAGDRVEELLARAHDALVGIDLDEAERALAGAELVLRAHPELPQAAWLRAEVERTWAARWLREPHASRENDERAARAWKRGTALDGGRAPGLGERAFEADPAVNATVALGGDARGARVRIDGAYVTPGSMTRGAGEHAVILARSDGAVTWAAWVPFEEGTALRLVAPSAPACSRDDLAHARVAGEAVDSGGARCSQWVAVAASSSDAPGAIRVATCEGSTCGPLVEWRAHFASDVALPVEPPHAGRPRGLPTWAAWTLAGVAVAGTAVAAALATSAFKPAPTETRFVNGGLQIHAF